MENLTYLYLGGSRLSGQIPVELADLANLEDLYLHGNEFSGCVPAALYDVPQNDLIVVPLPVCSGN